VTGPKLENGYLRLANELFDAVLAFPFSKRELLIVLAVIRKTYGFNKKSDEISNYQLAKMTKISLQHIGTTLDKLSSIGVLTVNETGTVKRGQPVRRLGVNKHWHQWATVNESGTVGNESFSKRTVDCDSKRIGKSTVNETGTTKDNTKDNKDNSARPRARPRVDPILPNGLNLIAWGEYLEHRRAIKARKLKTVSVEKLAAWLVNQGDAKTQQQIVDQTVRNGWTGLFELKGGNGNAKNQANNGGDSRSRAQRVSDTLDDIARESDKREMDSGAVQETAGEVRPQVDISHRRH
jgi:phage replication O-like protein O